MCIRLSHVGKSVTTGILGNDEITRENDNESNQKKEHSCFSNLKCNNSATPGVCCQGLYIA